MGLVDTKLLSETLPQVWGDFFGSNPLVVDAGARRDRPPSSPPQLCRNCTALRSIV